MPSNVLHLNGTPDMIAHWLLRATDEAYTYLDNTEQTSIVFDVLHSAIIEQLSEHDQRKFESSLDELLDHGTYAWYAKDNDE